MQPELKAVNPLNIVNKWTIPSLLGLYETMQHKKFRVSGLWNLSAKSNAHRNPCSENTHRDPWAEHDHRYPWARFSLEHCIQHIVACK